ncbi:MAG TPA: hypothetical protein VNG51_10845 [Ktedonobacteraceae bacterium]|nr:hypothetical protein [Ktedonobacteraceae bacterium]
MTEYTNFRQRLDAVLRTLDVKQVSEFLIAEKQWSAGQPADPNFAMWMMIAGTPTLQDLHGRARDWLLTQGYEDEARALLERGKKQKQGGAKKKRK